MKYGKKKLVIIMWNISRYKQIILRNHNENEFNKFKEEYHQKKAKQDLV
jgi:hypothetical protein